MHATCFTFLWTMHCICFYGIPTQKICKLIRTKNFKKYTKTENILKNIVNEFHEYKELATKIKEYYESR